MEPITMITLSREYGAGAGLLAAALGARLGWRVLDEEIAPTVARRLGLPDDALVEWDEHAPTLLEKVGRALVMGSPDWLVDPEVASQPDAADVARATRELLLEAAETPALVVVEHGAQALFHGRPGVLHLRLVAPLEVRVARVCARRACDAREAVALARRLDADRVQYLREFFGHDVHDPLLYHLQVNTGAVELDEAIEAVTRLVEGRRTAGAGAASGAGAGEGEEEGWTGALP